MKGRRTAGAVAGALVAGLGLTAMMMAQEKKTRKASELTDLGRASAHQLGVHHVPTGKRPPDPKEQAAVQGGHLMLSALAGLAYAAVTDEDADVLLSGIAFGLAFYGIAHWLTGPLLGVKQPEWRSDPGTISALPDGYVEGSANDRRYGVTVTRSPDRRRQWLYAEELGEGDRISFNLYLLESGPALRPCEMPAEKVISFVAAFRPNTIDYGRTAAAPERCSHSIIDGRTHA